MRPVCFLLILSLLALNAIAQNKASIDGTVLSKNTQSPLGGITIQLNPAGLSSLSDSAGNFRLADLVPGSYSLVFSGVGFQTKTFSNIVLSTCASTHARQGLNDLADIKIAARIGLDFFGCQALNA